MPQRTKSLVIALVAVGTMVWAAAYRSGMTPEADSESKPVPVATASPRYWKGNLHTHSFWSDGDDFPEMIAAWYKDKGYDFLSLTDHNILSDGEKWVDMTAAREVALKKYRDRFGPVWVEERKIKEKVKTKDKDKKEKEVEQEKYQVRLKPLSEFRSLLEAPGKFLLIQGEEITHKFAKNPVHMNAINLRDVIKPIDGPSIAETIQVNHRLVFEQRKKAARNILTFVNHPNFGWGVRGEDLLVDEVRFFEVFNGHPGVKNYGDATHVSTERMWDIVLSQRLGKLGLGVVYGMATDDSHGYHTFGLGKVNPGRGWVMVRAPFLTAEHIVAGLNRGDYYLSSGVVLKDVRRDGDKFIVEIQGEPGVSYKTEFIATMKDAPLDSAPVKDDKGEVLPVTRKYSPEVGKVLAESDALNATYRLTGKELYVRARITSTKPHPNPYAKGDVEMAWTQPIVP